MTKYSIGEFSRLVSTGISTLQKWDREGVLVSGRTKGGRRYYTDDHLNMLLRRGHKVYFGVRSAVDGVPSHDMVNRADGLEALIRRLAMGAGVVLYDAGEAFDGKLGSLKDLFPEVIFREVSN